MVFSIYRVLFLKKFAFGVVSFVSRNFAETNFSFADLQVDEFTF